MFLNDRLDVYLQPPWKGGSLTLILGKIFEQRFFKIIKYLSAVRPLAQRTFPFGVVMHRVTFSSMSNSRSRGFNLKKSVERLNSVCFRPAGKTDSQPTGIL